MNNLFFEETRMTPRINFDCGTGIFEISGRSVPENALAFYKPVLDWMEGYIDDPLKFTVLKIYLDYFNTTSAKYFLEIFKKFESLNKNNEVLIEWYYDEDDEDMLETGEGYGSILRIPFTLRTKNWIDNM